MIYNSNLFPVVLIHTSTSDEIRYLVEKKRMNQFNSERGPFGFTLPTFGIIIGSLVILCLMKWRREINSYMKQRSIMIKFAETLPGPPAMPVIGNALQFKDNANFAFTITRISQELNLSTFKIWIGPFLFVVVLDPRDVEITLLSTKAAKKSFQYDFMKSVMEDGLINSFGHVYKSHKKLVMKLLNDTSYMERSIDSFNYHANGFIKCLEDKVDQPQFNIKDYLENCAGDIIFETIYGLPQRAQLGDVSEYFHIFDEGLGLLSQRFFNPWFWSDFLFSLSSTGKKSAVINHQVKQWASSFVQKKQENLKTNLIDGISKDEGSSLFDKIINHVYKTNEWTDVQLRNEVIVLFIATHDTLTHVGSFVILMLAMHPDVQEKARQEIRMNFNDNENVIDVNKLKYLEMVVKETLRLFPAGAISARETTDELKLATCTVPKGCTLLLPFDAIHKDPNSWRDHKKFDPERFSPDNPRDNHPYAFIPFSGGQRSCPGQKYAMTCLKIIMAYLLRSYRLETNIILESLRLITQLTTQSKDGFPISIKKL